MASTDSKRLTIDDVQLQFIKEIGHEPHSASQMINFCKQKNHPFKYKDIVKWWPNRAKTKQWTQNSTNTAYQIHGSSNKYSTFKIHGSSNTINKEEMIRNKISNISQQTVSTQNEAKINKKLKEYDQVFYDPSIKCYDGNAKTDRTKSDFYSLSDKDYVKFHKFQEEQDSNYKKKNKNKFYVENIKYSQHTMKNKKKPNKKATTKSSNSSKQTMRMKDVHLEYIKEIGDKPDTQQLLNFCKQKNLSFKYKEIENYLLNEAKQEMWIDKILKERKQKQSENQSNKTQSVQKRDNKPNGLKQSHTTNDMNDTGISSLNMSSYIYKSSCTENDDKLVKTKNKMILSVHETFDASNEYIHLLQIIVYGYLRIITLKYNLFIPSDIKRLCYLWYHPNTIYLTIITQTKKHFSIGMVPNETILNLKEKIEDKEGIPVRNQHLIQINLGKTLLDKFYITDYNLHNNDVLQLKLGYR